MGVSLKVSCLPYSDLWEVAVPPMHEKNECEGDYDDD